MEKIYSSAPLPFQGQKRRFVRVFKNELSRFEGITTVVDLFGGSGLLSHVAKRENPALRVVYNDYDNFSRRLSHVKTTNEILAQIRPLFAGLKPNQRVPENIKQQVLEIILAYSAAGYVDYITLSSSLLFSGCWAKEFNELAAGSFYNVIKQVDYKVDGYLDGLEVVHKDYRELFAEFKDDPHVLFLIDPPYLSTESTSYENYWKLADYLDVLKLLVGTRYIYFTSNKSQIVELCQWIGKNASMGNPFEGVELRTQTNNLNYNARFTDMMLVRS